MATTSSRIRILRSALAATGALLLLASGAPGARVSVNRDWMPLQEGNRWSYRTTKDRLYRVPQGPSQSVHIEGSDVQEVTRSLGRFAGAPRAYEVTHQSRQVESHTGAEETGSQSMILSAAGGRLTMHTGRVDDAPIRILRPVNLLPAAPQAGMTWDAGEFEVQGMRFRMQGEVVGFEDVSTPAGVFPRCLKIHYTGQVSGEVVVQGTRVRIQSATLESFEWFAPGVGSAKETSKLHMSIAMPNGVVVEGEETSTRVLDGYQVGSGGRAPAAPAAPR